MLTIASMQDLNVNFREGVYCKNGEERRMDWADMFDNHRGHRGIYDVSTFYLDDFYFFESGQ
ncbi:hypothetical protein GCM10026983_43920 [Gracilibacillus alcaliphilus]